MKRRNARRMILGVNRLRRCEGALEEALESQSEIVVTRHGKPIAKLIPIKPVKSGSF
jgi:prevent-host-death family protein